MKLFRFGILGKEKPGVIFQGEKKDVSSFGEDYNEHFFETDGLQRLEKWVTNNYAKLPSIFDSTRLGSPICRPSKIVCIGLNYKDHAKEINMPVPLEPIVFLKSTSAIVGSNDDLIIPKNSKKTDWEVELGVVIGKKATYVSKEDALNYVAGYVLHNDYSERGFQIEKGGQWTKGKSCDSFAPLGPFMATKDEIPDTNNLRLWLKVNEVIKQNGTTSQLIFDIPYLISYLSMFMTLLPGDIISTGTPAGVGSGFATPQYLQPGNIVEFGITGLGSAKQFVRLYEEQ